MRTNSLVIAIAAFLSATSASPTSLSRTKNVVHEKRNAALEQVGWERVEKLPGQYKFPMRVGLAQSNLEHGDRMLMDVSDPLSPNFGKHWTPAQVLEFFRPSENSIKAVADWLHGAGIDMERHRLSPGHNWIEFNITTAEAKSLLMADYHLFKHGPTDSAVVGCDHYSVPEHIQQHIDFITPGTSFFKPEQKGRGALAKREDVPEAEVLQKRAGDTDGKQSPGHILYNGPKVNINKKVKSNDTILAACATHNVEPDCLRYMYQFSNPGSIKAGNSYGIVEYTPQSYLPSDLDLFFSTFHPEMIGQRPVLDSIDGGFLASSLSQYNNYNYEGESDLDLVWSMDFVYPQQVTLFQVGDLDEGASFNNFLDAIDGSYCTYEGGDLPGYDGTYPDKRPGAYNYNHTEDCGRYGPTKVISTSYGGIEAEVSPFYAQRQCSEYMKLGLMGTTVLYSSGDDGVAGNSNYCLGKNGTFTKNRGSFAPSFPAGCPYITSVGATEVINGTNIKKDEAHKTNPEQACSTVIYSGGGFSNYFQMPAYQATAVKTWAASHSPNYPQGTYNDSGMARGYPDISSNGAWWLVAVAGNFDFRWFGTSLSSPTWGSLITLINNERLKAGKGTVGFINPTLYSNVDALLDVTKGNNPGCNTTGFNAVPGWDPVTGLGTPIYPKLLKVFMDLP